MKLKVHAQRKFAQGAFVPPSAAAASVERRVDVAPAREENRNVYFNRMSAVSLLDIVAFQNMHSHTEPVVLLERLEEIQEVIAQPVAEVNGHSPAKAPTTNGNVNHKTAKLVKPLRYTRPKRTGGLSQRAQRQSMHLRSRLGSSFKPKSRVAKKKCGEKPRVGARALRRRRVPSPAESYDMDDDKPLTYIAQVLRRTVALRSDRNLRKRRGEELTSTSKPPPKADDAASDSDDEDSATTNGPTKPKLSNVPKPTPATSTGFKVNEGAGTSKQPDTRTLSPRKEVANRQPSDPTRTTTSILRSNEGSVRSQTPRSTSRMMRNNNLVLKKVISKNRHGTIKKYASTGGIRTRRLVPTVASVRGVARSQVVLQKVFGPKDDLPLQAIAHPTSSHHTRSSTQSPPITMNNERESATHTLPNHTEIRPQTQAQKSSQDTDHNLRSNPRVQQMMNKPSVLVQPMRRNDLDSSTSTSAQQTNPNIDFGHRSFEAPSTSFNSDHRLRSSARAQLSGFNVNIERRPILKISPIKNRMSGHKEGQSRPVIQSVEFDAGVPMPARPVPQNTLTLRSSPRQSASQNDRDLEGGAQAISTAQSNRLELRSSRYQPASHKRDHEGSPKVPLMSQRNPEVMRSMESQPTVRLTTLELSPTVVVSQCNQIPQASSSLNQQTIQSNDSTQDIQQSTSNNTESIRQPQTESNAVNIDLTRSPSPQPTDEGIQDPGQAPTTANDPDAADTPPARPANQANTQRTNNTRGLLGILNNHLHTRANIRQLLFQGTDLDLRVNSRPLTAIHNYDWDFGASRNRSTFQNNLLGFRANFRPRDAARNVNPQQGTNTRLELTVRNDLGLGGTSQALPPVNNADAQLRANPIPQSHSIEPASSSGSPAQPVLNDGVPSRLNSDARPIFRDDIPRRMLSARPSIRRIDGPRHTVRNDNINAGGVWPMRPTFRGATIGHRPRSTLLNEEIRPRPRPRPTPHYHHHHLDPRLPNQPIRDQARYWNNDTNGSERSREQRNESLAATRPSRNERIAATAAEREHEMTLDEALRECVLTAQSVTAEESKPMQRRQAIAARQQRLSECSPLSRRNATRRTTHTDTGVNGRHRSAERNHTSSPQRSEPEPGPSKMRRRKQTSSPGDVGTRTRSSDSEPDSRKEPQPDTESGLSKLRRKKPASSDDSRRQSDPQAESQHSDSDPDMAPSKIRKKKSTSPGDCTNNRQSPDREAEPQPAPTKLRRKTLLGGMLQRSRMRSPERFSEPPTRKSPAKDRNAIITMSQERTNESSESNSEANDDSADSSTSSRLTPGIEPSTDQCDIEIPADRIARISTPRRPIVEGWLKNVIRQSEEERPHFKVPRIPVARKSIERRPNKPVGGDRDDAQSSPTPEPNATPSKEEDEEDSTAKVLAATKKDIPFPSRENLAEPIIQPKIACLSKHYSTVRSIVHATDSELSDRCGHCIFCTRVDKIRKLSNLVQNQRKPVAAANEVYDFDADREDSHENTRLYNFRQNRKAKLLETKSDGPKDPVYLDVLPPQNPHIIEITSVQMPNQVKPMLRARLIRKTDANLENEFSLIEHENLLDQLLEIKISNTDQALKKPVPIEVEDATPGPSMPEPVQADVTDSAEDVELNYETDDSSEFLARLQTRLNTRKRTEQTTLRSKVVEKPSLVKKSKVEKKPEPAKKVKGVKKGQEEPASVEPPKNYLSDNLSNCFREAPVFHPTEEEFLDPLAYFEKIYPVASQFGLCKVVAPSGFKPKCTITDDVRFNVANQYISRLYCRWGSASKEMCAIKAYLAEQKVFFTRPPLIEGIELNLPKLYRTVQRHGGLKKVIEKKRWGRVAEDMQFPRGPRSAKRIDQLYVKHLLPYDTLSSAERRELMDTVEHSWNRNYKKMLSRASNPLHRQKRLMGESESSDEVDTDEDANLAYALAEAEDCVVTGRCMKLSVFKKVASNVMCTLFPNTSQPSPSAVEREYWALVGGACEHVCVNAASIDTGEEGYGFSRAKHDGYSRHPWNLKMFSQNSGNVLRSLGPVLGVTVPTLHLGMVFSTSCWHRDPHGLPWLEYMHHGPPKIWYGIPDELSADFRKAVETLCPTSCQNKSIWLPSDITMIPPHLLRAANVPLSRTVQSPGEFVVVCPKAYSSSIATGYTESESVYFAPTRWLTDVADVFQELRASCEPTMFSLSQLLLAVALDARAPDHVLGSVLANLRDVVREELARRDALDACGVQLIQPEQNRATCSQARKRPAGAWNVREQDECEICRTTLYLSKVTGLTSKRSSLCLEHALLLIDKDKKRYARDVSGIVATIFVLRAELEDAVKRVEQKLSERKDE